nr:phenylalanine--tRNA ligase subunit beta [Bacteroidales bacterium]
MWLSLNIIEKMVDISDISPEDLANKLTMSTAEIDSIDYINQHFKTIITAKANSVTKHPDADKLTLVDIDTGSEKLPVVCGAPNHKTGDIVALATVGTKFTEEFSIKESKIRGEISKGMLCSAKELGLSEDHDGILIFPENTEIGIPLSEIYKEWVDVRLEIDNKSITHRPDLWSHYGFAREIGAILGRPVKSPVNFELEKELGTEKSLSVKIENPGQGLRYSGLVMKNITVGESPEWLKAAVTSIGMRPINNLVDITNYVMAEIGEPMHAFDRKKLRGNEIIVRNAKAGEKLTTLDDQKLNLCEEDIVIADKDGAIALAGVMGGGNSEIDDNTSEIILEAANFNAVNIRKTATRYNLRTEAAIRFEKSQSSELTTLALLRCYELIKKCSPEAQAVTPIIDDYPEKSKAISLSIDTETIRQRLGEEI